MLCYCLVMIIYKITNKVTGKIYIGQTKVPLRVRWARHKSSKRISPLSSSIKKHGIEVFKIEAICSGFDREGLNQLERYLIKYYDCVYPKGYNLLPGGNCSENIMVPWNKGRKASEEAKANQSISHLGQKAWNTGLTTTEPVKAKQSKAKLGKRMSPSTEFKLGQTSVFKGKKHTDEAKSLIAANNAASIELYCMEQDRYYSSIAEASKINNISKSHLRRCALTERSTKGLTFKLVRPRLNSKE